MSRRTLGGYAEQLAAQYLRYRGWQILAQNYNVHGGELDIVAKDLDEIVFVEVKSLRAHDRNEIFATVTNSKLHKIHKAAQVWISHHKQFASDWRVDFLGVILDPQQQLVQVEHVAYL